MVGTIAWILDLRVSSGKWSDEYLPLEQRYKYFDFDFGVVFHMITYHYLLMNNDLPLLSKLEDTEEKFSPSLG